MKFFHILAGLTLAQLFGLSMAQGTAASIEASPTATAVASSAMVLTTYTFLATPTPYTVSASPAIATATAYPGNPYLRNSYTYPSKGDLWAAALVGGLLGGLVSGIITCALLGGVLYCCWYRRARRHAAVNPWVYYVQPEPVGATDKKGGEFAHVKDTKRQSSPPHSFHSVPQI
ncbi:hypothetical protein T439DRAFT_327261 [Meredithblackwellia eburnea MCA 4105]